MTRLSKCLFAATALVAVPTIAFAQDAPPPDPATGGGGEGTGDGTATPPADPTATPPEATPSAAAGGRFGKSYIDRLLHIWKGGIEVNGTLHIDYTSVTVAGMTSSETFIGLGVGGRYGVTDKIELLGSYSAINFSPDFEAKGALTVGAGMGLVDNGAGGKLDVEAKAAFGYDLLGETAVIFVGADVRYKLTPKMWIGTPVNQPGLVITVKGVDIPAIPPAPAITIAPIFFDLPFAFGFQVTPELHAQLSTRLLRLAINDDAGDSAFVGADFFDVTLGAIYGLSDKMDVVVNLGLGDLKNAAGDNFEIGLGVNFRP